MIAIAIVAILVEAAVIGGLWRKVKDTISMKELERNICNYWMDRYMRLANHSSIHCAKCGRITKHSDAIDAGTYWICQRCDSAVRKG